MALETEGLAECCLRTVAVYGKNNPMMNCLWCKKIIKYFTDAPAFRNYRKFCISKRRKFAVAQHDDHCLIAFDRPT